MIVYVSLEERRNLYKIGMSSIRAPFVLGKMFPTDGRAPLVCLIAVVQGIYWREVWKCCVSPVVPVII